MKAIEWRDGVVRILDQTALPRVERYFEAGSVEEMVLAIRRMSVRGAPLLGIAAGYAMALSAVGSSAKGSRGMMRDLHRAGARLVASRPTAVNIGWAVERVLGAAQTSAAGGKGVGEVCEAVVDEAMRIAVEDEASCRAIGAAGARLIPAGANVLTHCNTGSLATGGDGTAQSVLLAAHRAGKGIHVWVGETRPALQGARLTAWELQRHGVPMTLVADTAAASLMSRRLVDRIVVGADRIAVNGDVANKLGTYQLAVLAAHHRIPFYVAAPVSTVDPDTPTGDRIVIEERDPAEVTSPFGVPFAPEGTVAANPAFDVTPARLVSAIITDRGVARPPFGPRLRSLLSGKARRPA